MTKMIFDRLICHTHTFKHCKKKMHITKSHCCNIIISTRLKFANQITYLMRIDTHVTYGACQILIFCIVDMPSSFGINILFGKSEVHDMNDM